MSHRCSSASSRAILLVAVLVAAGPAQAAVLGARSVGEIFVDAQGRASGQNLATRIHEASGLIEGFSAIPLGTMVFESVRIDGFSPREKIQGAGSSALTLKGDNALVALHDNAHSVVQIHALAPTSVAYKLAPDVAALQEGRHGALVRLTHETRGYLGHLVAVGSEGVATRGEVMQVRAGEVIARAQAGSQLVFLAKAASGRSEAFQSTLVEALAQGALVSHAITEFESSRVATSQVDVGRHAQARTVALASGIVETALSTRASAPTLLVYDLAYETLPARGADDVAVYVDGVLAQRVHVARDAIDAARSGVASYHAAVADGRTQVVVAGPQGQGEHQVTVSVGARASTEAQGRAESRNDDEARAYGSFEYHANGKLVGAFLTGVIPDGRATLLSFTQLASRTELFRSVSVDGGAQATFHASGADQMRLATPKADLTLIDDAHATLLVAAKAPAVAAFDLAHGIHARQVAGDLILLDGAAGRAGALVLTDGPGSASSLAVDHASGRVTAQLAAGSRLVFRGAPDGHASEDAVLRAIADGALAGQVLAGVQQGALVARATTLADDTTILVRPDARALRIDARIGPGEPHNFAVDVRGAALAVRSAADVRVSLDGVTLAPVASAEDVLAADGEPAYFAQTSLDGALRIIVRAREGASTILIDSLVEESARAQARTDAFGAFKLYHDGTAIGSFVTLKADRALGAVSGLSLVAEGRPVFTSLVAGRSAYASTGTDGSTVLRLENREARLEISDSTNAFTRIHALQGTDAAFRLAAGLRPEARGPGVVEILSRQGEHVGSIVMARGGALETRGQDEVHARLAQGGELVFRSHAGIESELSAAQRTMINQAIASGRVAGHVLIQTQASAHLAADELERTARAGSEGLGAHANRAHGAVTSAVTASYSDVTILTAATRERVELTVGSMSKTGKTLLVSLDPDTIPGMAQGRATIRFDGEIVGQASSYADILDANDDDGLAEYFVLAGDAGTQVLVSIPSFSVHTVTLEQRAEEPQTLYMYATLFLGLLVVVESVLLARGARKNTITNRRP